MTKVQRLILLILFQICPFLLSSCSMMHESHYSDETPSQYLCSSAITLKVKMKLHQDRELKNLPISVSTYKGIVQLSGFVDSSAQKRKAAELASHVRGVKQVKNSLIVKTC